MVLQFGSNGCYPLRQEISPSGPLVLKDEFMPARMICRKYLVVSAALILSLPFNLNADPCFNTALNPVQRKVTYPLTAAHISYVPTPVTPVDCYRFGVDGVWATVETGLEEYTVDAETRHINGRISLPLTADWTLGVELPVIWRGGGVMDGPVEDWHDLFGLPQGGRDQNADDRYLVAGSSGSERFRFNKTGSGVGNLQLKGTYNLREGNHHRLLVSSLLSLPTFTPEYGHNGIDGGVELQYRYEKERWLAYAGIMQAFISDKEVSGLKYNSSYIYGAIGAGYRIFHPSVSLIVQLGSNTAIVKSVPEHPDSEILLDIALSIQTGRRTAVTAGFQENPGPGNGSTDFALFAGFDYLFAIE